MAQDLRLWIFQGAPLLQHLRRRNSSGNFLFCLPLVALGSFAVLAAAGEDLGQAHLAGLLCHDVKAYIYANDKLCDSAPPSERMSFLRDLPLLITITLLSLTPGLMYRQWLGIESFLDSMERRNILTWPKGRAAVLQEVRSCNTYFRRASRTSLAILAFSFLSVSVVCKALAVGSDYPVLDPAGHGGAVKYSLWWAAISSEGWAWLGYVGWGTLFVYSVALQNVYGGRAVVLLWRTRKSIGYTADVDNLDGHFGWSDVRRILLCTWTAIIIHGIAMAMVAISLPNHPAIVLSPLLIQWLATTPFYVGIPIYLIRKNIANWKSAELTKLMLVQGPAASAQQVTAAGAMADRIRKVRVNPYAGMTARIVYLLGFVSSLTVVIQILRIIY
ncbi:hypothetical protein ABZX12_02520 [Kribbella sp. NPDC003505]|uniref:hypothetical protein n=1 Tax=Kribbella sp. NPDC003505 TaxID=3154448 RepID=UPI0033B7FCC6